jgi:hypothetical protein
VTLDELIRDLFGQHIGVADIEAAFSIDHRENGERFISRAKVTLGVDAIEIRGEFFCINGSEELAGSFMRRLFRTSLGVLSAHHMTIRIDSKHQFKHIAKTHYQKALQFYLCHGIIRVFMEANQDGPAVWPGFGFELLDSNQQDRLRQLVEIELEKYEIPLAEAVDPGGLRPVAPLLLAVEIEVPDGRGGQEVVEVGQIAMRRLYEEAGEELRMACWLDHPASRQYLEELGLKLPEL